MLPAQELKDKLGTLGIYDLKHLLLGMSVLSSEALDTKSQILTKPRPTNIEHTLGSWRGRCCFCFWQVVSTKDASCRPTTVSSSRVSSKAFTAKVVKVGR